MNIKIDELLGDIISGLEILKEHLRSRSISNDQSEIILRYLDGLPKSSIMVDFAGGNAESRQYAQQIVDVLKTAGWSVSETHIMGSPRQGFGIVATREYETRAHNLRDAFLEAGIDTPVTIEPMNSGNEFWLVVGEKDDPLVSD